MNIEELAQILSRHKEEFAKSGKTGFNMPEALHIICQEIIGLKAPKSYGKSSAPYIKNPDLFKAVNFADAMIKKGTAYEPAVRKAAEYYKANPQEVADELRKRGK